VTGVAGEKTTRPPTTGEVHAARLRGAEDPWAPIEVDERPAGVRLVERIERLPPSRKPKGVSTAEWYARRARASDPDEEEGDPGAFVA